MKVVWTPLAELRTAEAFNFIAAERASAAVRWLNKTIDAIAALEAFPDSGRLVPEVARHDIRELIVRPYRIIYRRDPNRVVILTVRHERRAFDMGEVGP